MALFGIGKKKDGGASAPAGQVTLGDGQTYTIARQVDCLGDSCPRPQLMTKKTLGQVGVGDVIEVLIDNPSSVEAIPPMLDDLGATHLETVKAERRWEVYIRKD